jgi:hypothetical protein
MTDKESKWKRPRRQSMENEVIIAVVLLYVIIAAVMVIVHYIQPPGQETISASTSPSHDEMKSPAPAGK